MCLERPSGSLSCKCASLYFSVLFLLKGSIQQLLYAVIGLHTVVRALCDLRVLEHA